MNTAPDFLLLKIGPIRQSPFVFCFSGPDFVTAAVLVTLDSASLGVHENRLATFNILYQRSFLRQEFFISKSYFYKKKIPICKKMKKLGPILPTRRKVKILKSQVVLWIKNILKYFQKRSSFLDTCHVTHVNNCWSLSSVTFSFGIAQPGANVINIRKTVFRKKLVCLNDNFFYFVPYTNHTSFLPKTFLRVSITWATGVNVINSRKTVY